jgi:hypothetical protein
LWWLWSQTWLSSCGALGFQDWWQLTSTQFDIFDSEYHCFLRLVGEQPDSALPSMHTTNVSIYFLYTMKRDKFIQWILSYI